VLAKKNADIYVVDLVRDKLSFSNSLRAVATLKSKWPDTKSIYIEDKANGTAIIDTLKSKIQGIIAVEPMGSKTARAEAVSSMVEAGNIWLPRPAKASWVEPFIEECAVFPNGANDDQVDALSQGLLKLRDKKVTTNISPMGMFKPSLWS
jgi:predicted phage terminase large subunit-like protein